MATQTNPWVLFGYDLRGLWRGYVHAWREVLWYQGSVWRQRLDEPVSLAFEKDGERHTEVLGRPEARVVARAELLAEEQVLFKTLRLPRHKNVDVQRVVHDEVLSSSPFAAEDTASGWRMTGGSAQTLEILMALTSRNLVNEHLQRYYLESERSDIEVWVSTDSHMLMLEGFGESVRNRRYVQRLRKLALLSLLVGGLVCVLALVPVLYQAQRASSLESELAVAARAARPAQAHRAAQNALDEQIAALNSYLNQATRPLEPLDILTRVLPDSAWLTSYKQKGVAINIDGVAENAAALTQELSQLPAFSGVRATSAIRKIGRDGLDRFQLQLQQTTTAGLEP